MNFKQLQSFIAVADYKSFTTAAQKTFSSQPTISAHISALEKELKTSLVTRNTKQLEITDKGWELYECANSIFRLLNNLERRWSKDSENVVNIGASTIPSSYFLPEILSKYSKDNKDTYFLIDQGDSSEIIRGMQEHLYDIAMIGMFFEDEQFESIPFYRDRLAIIAPNTPHYAEMHEKTTTPLEKILKEPVILREFGSASRDRANQILEAMNVTEGDMEIVARVSDQETIKNLVAGGLGISILSERAAQNFVEAGKVLLFDLPKAISERDLYLLVPKGWGGAKDISRFVRFVLDFYS